MKVAMLLQLVATISLLLNISADVRTDMLNRHNSARAAVRVGGLVWSDEVAAFAQNWVVTLRDQRGCDMVHSGGGGKYGENLWKWMGSSGLPAPNPADAVQSWVNEKADYDYASNSCAAGKVCGHYTQVVWRNSQRLGCASVKCNGVNHYLVSCNYDPPGNWIGERPYLTGPAGNEHSTF